MYVNSTKMWGHVLYIMTRLVLKKKHELQYKVQLEHKTTIVQAWSNNEIFFRQII